MNAKRSGRQVEGDSRPSSCMRPAHADRIADRLGSELIPGQVMIGTNDQGAKTPRTVPPAGEVLKLRIAGFLSDFSIETIPTSRWERRTSWPRGFNAHSPRKPDHKSVLEAT